MRYLFPVLMIALGLTAAHAQTQTTTPTPTPEPDTVVAAKPSSSTPSAYSSAHVDGPYIAMTFDDGPSPLTTPHLLDLLEQRHIKATFFLIGQNAEKYPDLVRRILADGNEIGNHSWSHPQLSKLSDDRVNQEISKTQDTIKNETGFTPTIMRPPYGALTKKQREWIEQKYGLNIILWSVDPFDWKRPGGAVIEQRILSGARPGAIILSHDIHKQTVDAMPATLAALADKGFKFVTVSQLLAMNKPPAAAAKKSSPAAVNAPAPAPASTTATSTTGVRQNP